MRSGLRKVIMQSLSSGTESPFGPIQQSSGKALIGDYGEFGDYLITGLADDF